MTLGSGRRRHGKGEGRGWRGEGRRAGGPPAMHLREPRAGVKASQQGRPPTSASAEVGAGHILGGTEQLRLFRASVLESLMCLFLVLFLQKQVVTGNH